MRNPEGGQAAAPAEGDYSRGLAAATPTASSEGDMALPRQTKATAVAEHHDGRMEIIRWTAEPIAVLPEILEPQAA